MVQFDGLRPARLKVGIISAGRVGTALGVALERAEHVVVACSAISHASRQRAAHRLPDTTVAAPQDGAAAAELLLLAVPDSELAGLVSGLAATSAVRPGTIVAHTSGANGVGILAPLTPECIPLAIHPAMTFTGSDEDISRLPDTCFGITAADDVGYAIGQSLVLEMGGSRSVSARTPVSCTTPLWPTPATTSWRCSPMHSRRCGPRCAAANYSANKPSTTSRAALPNASSGRWPGRRWRTPCNGARPRSPGRSHAVTRPPSPSIWPRWTRLTPSWPTRIGSTP